MHSLEADGASLNTGEYTELVGELDLDAFVCASHQTVAESKRCGLVLASKTDSPSSGLLQLENGHPTILDFSHETDPSEAARDWMAAELARAFDLTKAVFSWTLIRLAEARHFWCLIAHQLAVDGSARNHVARRMADNYSHLIGVVETKTNVPGPLSDLLREEAEYRQSEDFKKGRAYWLEQMADLRAPTRLTSRSSYGSYMPARYTNPLPACTSTAIRNFMADTGVSLSGFFVCVAALYLRRLTGASDITIGLLVAARTTPAARDAPGNVSNTVPVRLKINADTTLGDVIAQARERIAQSIDSPTRAAFGNKGGPAERRWRTLRHRRQRHEVRLRAKIRRANRVNVQSFQRPR